MKKALSFLGYLSVFLLIAVVVFFFWASSPNYNKEEYARLYTQNNNQKTGTDSIYSIITYNIGYLSGMTNNKAIDKPKSLFDTNLEKIKQEFSKINADIIALQEIDYASARSYTINQQNEIATLGYDHIAQAINWDETYMPFPYWPPSMHFGNILSGQSIISKYPLSDHQRIVLDRVDDSPFYRDAFYLERLAQIVMVTIENKPVVLINVHLEAFDKTTRLKQLDVVIDLFNTYRKKYPTILLGDFNSEARKPNAGIHKLFEMSDVGNAAFNQKKIKNTFSSAEPFKRIDYIFYTSDFIEMVNSKVLQQFGQASDHLPVEMQFRLK